MKSYAYGFPRLGGNREYKKAIEGFWKNELTPEQLFEALDSLQRENTERYRKAVDNAPDGEMTLYDPMLDAAVLYGLFSPQNLQDYYSLCRGSCALELTKWFNTNYHYLITDFSQIRGVKFSLNINHFALRYKQGGFPSVVGPFTFLKLSKGIAPNEFEKLLFDLAPIYCDLLSRVRMLQIEEPAFVMDLSEREIAMIKEIYGFFSSYREKIVLMTYYDSVDWIGDLLKFNVAAIGFDFVRGAQNFEHVCRNGISDDKMLLAGLVDGRNIWKNNISDSVDKLKRLSLKVKNLAVSNAAPLFHLPISLKFEKNLDPKLKNKLSFAREKLEELRLIAGCFDGKANCEKNTADSYGRDISVQKRIAALKESDFIKPVSLQQRRRLHQADLNLPAFPTTTIGSFPQTKEVRQKRSLFRKGELSKARYEEYINGEIDRLIDFQQELGLDVFVHGEYERSDMVEFFAQHLKGIATTQSGWIISYGSRCYRPPIIFGDVSRPQAMTVGEIAYAQSRTKKPLKGMLTGAVTIIAWSFCREDVALDKVAYQIALSLKDEISDYEKEGIKIVQVDEAAFREKAPIKKKNWPAYFDWAVKSFNLATNTNPATQIHTHMCYSEFGRIIGYINKMDFDVISIEASRSHGDIIAHFENIDFKRQIGLGVWDIHSPAVPSVERMLAIVERSLKNISKENFWINPDCGLKTRDWPEVKAALKNMVLAAGKLRVKG